MKLSIAHHKLIIKKIKYSQMVIVLLFFLFWVLLGFNTYMYDYSNYVMFYKYAHEGVRYPGIEIGFYFFMFLCNKMGLSYSGFLKVYAFIGVFMIFSTVCKYSRTPLKVLILFLFFPYFLVMSAVRNFMAAAIIIWAMRFLLQENVTKRDIIKYIFSIIIAAQFHSVSFFYLLFILTVIDEKKIRMLSNIFFVGGVITIVLNQYILNIFVALFPKLSVYISSGLHGTRFETKIFLLIYFIAKIIFCNLLLPYIDDTNLAIYKINIFTTCILPLCFINMNFMRIEYNIILFMAIMVFDQYNNLVRVNPLQNITWIKGIYFVYYIISGYILLYLFSYESVVKTILTNNQFFDMVFR